MSTYIFGDIQGCFTTFKSLLKKINFNPEVDRAILLGDVINRGPNSLEMIRYIYEHQASISMVLGNHEIYAIALCLDAINASGAHTLGALLDASDGPKLFAWLRHQPVLLKQDNNVFVHAGILPAVDINLALTHSALVQSELSGPKASFFLQDYFAARIFELSSGLDIRQTAIMALAYFTLMRTCTSKEKMDLSFSGPLTQIPSGHSPWFKLRKEEELKIFFGHWAALGFYHYKNYFCLDSGCVWGRKLSALRLDDHQVFQVENCEFIP